MTGVQRDDRLLAPTWWTAVLIDPVLAGAFGILFFFPAHTRALWAWTITPSMTPMVMGGGYLSGTYFFARVFTSGQWHRVWMGFVAASVFTPLLLVATLLHWSKFHHGHVMFWLWLALYVVTPPLLPLLWAFNRRTDPGVREPGDRSVDRRLRAVLAGAGGLLTVAALVMFIRPQVVIPNWPWMLTPLTARTLSAFIAFPAVTCLCSSVEGRWSSLRIPLETVTIFLVFVGVAALRAHADMTGPAVSVALFSGSLAAAIAALTGLQLYLHRDLPAS